MVWLRCVECNATPATHTEAHTGTHTASRVPSPVFVPPSTQRVSPVTHSIGNCVKRVVVIVASVFFFRNPVSLLNASGTGIALAGVFAYSQVRVGRWGWEGGRMGGPAGCWSEAQGGGGGGEGSAEGRAPFACNV